jgi:hypothetical protein
MANLIGVIITNDKVYGFYNETICFEEKHNVELGKYKIDDLVYYGNDDLWKVISQAQSMAFTYGVSCWGDCRLVQKVINETLNNEQIFKLLSELK